MGDDTPSPLNNVITIDDDRIKSHLDRVVRGSVEETLNALLDAEADRLCNAQRYERSEARRDARAGHYERKLQTKAGEVRLKVPKLRQQTFETAIIERYRRRESSVEEALIEMYLAGVSVRRVEDLTEALWGTRVSPSTVSELNRKIYGTIEEWRNRAIEGEHEDKAGWSAFLKHLKERGLTGVRLIISDACIGLAESAAEFLRAGRDASCTGTATSSVTSRRQSAGNRGQAQGDPRWRGHCGGARKGHPSDREVARFSPNWSRRARGNGGRGDTDLLRLPGGALAQNPDQQSTRAHSA